MKKRRSWIALAAVVAVLGGSYWQWQRLPRNELAVVGEMRTHIEVVPRDLALAKPMVDFKVPVFGHIQFPKPTKVSPEEIAYLARNSAVGGLFRAKGQLFKDSDWEVDGVTSWAVTEAGLTWVSVPFAFGDHSKKVRFFANAKNGWSEVILPAFYRPAPKLEQLSLDYGQLSLRLTPRPIKTTLPFVDYDVSVHGGRADQRFALQIAGSDYGHSYESFYEYAGQPLRVRIPVSQSAVVVDIAECFDTRTTIRVARASSTKVEGFNSNGSRLFLQEGDYAIFPPGLGTGAFLFDDGYGRLGFGIEEGDITVGSWHRPEDLGFLKRFPDGKRIGVTIRLIGVRRSQRLELPKLDPEMFMKG